jgi:hypothetical protein
MKCLLILALVIAVVCAQIRERDEKLDRTQRLDREREREPRLEHGKGLLAARNPAQNLPSVRVALQGKLGARDDSLNTDFEGWSTVVNSDNLELSHCQARIMRKEKIAKSDKNDKKRPEQSSKILQAFSFHDSEVFLLSLWKFELFG